MVSFPRRQARARPSRVRARPRRKADRGRLRSYLETCAPPRLAILLVTAGAILTLLSAGRNVQPLEFAAGHIASRTVHALVDFRYFDLAQAQERAEQQAQRTPPVYVVDPTVADRIRGRLQRLESELRALAQPAVDPEARARVLAELADAWNKTASLRIEQEELLMLSTAGVPPDTSDEIMSVLSSELNRGVGRRTDGTTQFDGLAVNDLITVLNPADGSESNLDIHQLSYPGDLLSHLREPLRARFPDLPSPVQGVLFKLARGVIEGNLAYDRDRTNQLREQIRRAVLPEERLMRAGELIADRGQRITPQVLDILTAHEREWQKRRPTAVDSRLELGANALIVSLVLALGVALLALLEPHLLLRNSRLILLASLLLAGLLVTRALLLITPHPLPTVYVLSLTPYALGPMLGSILLGTPAGTLLALLTSLFASLMTGKSFATLFVALLAGFTATFATRRIRRRSDLLRAGALVGAITLLAASALGAPDRPLAAVALRQAVFGLTSGLGTALLVSGLLPLLEWLFRIHTDVSLLEVGDLNHPLLRRLILDAPGTYHHSMIVAQLAENAANAIGANGLMCRIGAYFHDIGKLTKPGYFVENSDEGARPHDALSPSMSALIIIAHVKDGVDLAIKHGLNARIIDFIREHHGTTLVSYFHHRALDQAQLRAPRDGNGGAPTALLDPSSFRYPGPRPRSRETAIVGLADAVEAASRSLGNPTANRLESLVAQIIDERYRENQLDECGLTLHELSVIRTSLTRGLGRILHPRIAYPAKDEAPDRKPKPATGAPAASLAAPAAPPRPVGSRPGSAAA